MDIQKIMVYVHVMKLKIWGSVKTVLQDGIILQVLMEYHHIH
nr:MAG TPA: hypothetical protein [Caudoviricetes sp.]